MNDTRSQFLWLTAVIFHLLSGGKNLIYYEKFIYYKTFRYIYSTPELIGQDEFLYRDMNTWLKLNDFTSSIITNEYIQAITWYSSHEKQLLILIWKWDYTGLGVYNLDTAILYPVAWG